MAYEECLGCMTLKAKDAINTPKVAVKLGTNGIEVAGADDEAIGIFQDPVKAGEAARVAVHGVSMCVAGEALAMGDNVVPGADGKCVKTTAPYLKMGTAVEVANAAGDIIGIALK